MINVYYDPQQTAKVKSFSPSPRKPAQVVEQWQKKFGDKLNFCTFEPVTQSQLKQVHSARYVDGIFDGSIPNGFGTTELTVAESLLYTSGSLLAAARDALVNGIAVSPTSGFHHSCYNGGGGFCTFNGLILAAFELYNDQSVDKVGILDCDFHYGNGTHDIIKGLGLDFIEHYTAGKDFHDPHEASQFLASLPHRMQKFKDCDILIYQAGADPFINDPLGGFLTEAQLAERDHIVFTYAKKMGLPVCWNLAGGYTDPFTKVLDIHNNTMGKCLNVYSTK